EREQPTQSQPTVNDNQKLRPLVDTVRLTGWSVVPPRKITPALAQRFLSSCLFGGGPKNSRNLERVKERIRRSGGIGNMRTLFFRGLLLLTAMAASAGISNAGPKRHDLREDRREIRRDTRDIRTDRRDIRRDERERRADVRDYRADKEDGASRRELREDRREIAG